MKNEDTGLVWYCKWAATASIIIGIAARAADVLPLLDITASLSGSLLWGVYAFHTHNRAMLVTSAVAGVMLLAGLLRFVA